jgi:hypothetical protein
MGVRGAVTPEIARVEGIRNGRTNQQGVQGRHEGSVPNAGPESFSRTKGELAKVVFDETPARLDGLRSASTAGETRARRPPPQ